MTSMKTKPQTSSQPGQQPQADTRKARRPVVEVDAGVVTSGSCATSEAQARFDRYEKGRSPRNR